MVHRFGLKADAMALSRTSPEAQRETLAEAIGHAGIEGVRGHMFVHGETGQPYAVGAYDGSHIEIHPIGSSPSREFPACRMYDQRH